MRLLKLACVCACVCVCVSITDKCLSMPGRNPGIADMRTCAHMSVYECMDYTPDIQSPVPTSLCDCNTVRASTGAP